MATVTTEPTVIRTERGLTIAGTRITLYQIMDCVKAGWPAKLMADRLLVTQDRIRDALTYIEAHRAEVEREYVEVLQTAEENRQYWEERNRERVAKIASAPPKPGQEELRAKLQVWKARLAQP